MRPKCIEIRVQVHDVDKEDKFHRDPEYAPESIYLFFEEHEPDYVYDEATDIKDAIHRLVTG